MNTQIPVISTVHGIHTNDIPWNPGVPPLAVRCDVTRGYFEITLKSDGMNRRYPSKGSTWTHFILTKSQSTQATQKTYGRHSVYRLDQDEMLDLAEIVEHKINLGDGRGLKTWLVIELTISKNLSLEDPRKVQLFIDTAEEVTAH